MLRCEAINQFKEVCHAWGDYSKAIEGIFKEAHPLPETIKSPKSDYSFTRQFDSRIDKTCNAKVETVTTCVSTPYGTATVACDTEKDNIDTGYLITTAKVAALNDNSARLLYNIAMNIMDNLGTNDLSHGILITLANDVCNGDYEKTLNKYLLKQERELAKKCKCGVCGRQYGNEIEARTCERKHKQRKEAKREKYLIRKEAKRRLAEREYEKKISKAMREISINKE